MPPLLLIFALVATAAAHGSGHFDTHTHREKGPRNIIIVEEAIECEHILYLRTDLIYF
jgi:hypothetical protein